MNTIPDTHLIPKIIRLLVDASAPEGEAIAALMALRRLLANADDKLNAVTAALTPPISIQDDLRMPWGCHRGESLASLAKSHPDYLKWCLSTLPRIQPWLRRAMREALQEANR